jgi:hypothetical protein
MTIKAQSGKVEHRKILIGNILRIRQGIVSAIMYRRTNGHSVTELRQDIINSINHVFGHYVECASYFCVKNKTDGPDYIEKIKSTDQDFYANVMKHTRNLARHRGGLLQDVDSNIVELYNAIIAKVIGGKRMNFAMNRSYSGKCMLAAVTKNICHPLYSLHKVLHYKNPSKGGFLSAAELKRKKKQNLQNISRIKNKRFKKQLFKNTGLVRRKCH